VQGGGGGPIVNMGGGGVAHSAPASTKPSAAPAMTADVMRVNASANGAHTPHALPTHDARRVQRTHIHTVSDIHHLSLNDLSASEWSHVVEQPQVTC